PKIDEQQGKWEKTARDVNGWISRAPLYGFGLWRSRKIAPILQLANDKRTDPQRNELRDFYRNRISPDFPQLNRGAAEAKKAADELDNSIPKVMVMDDAAPRETHTLVKGSYDKPAEKVDANVPAFLDIPLPKGVPNNRLALAKWLFDPANPLAARVTVNRYWQQFFGVGIVKTVDDFGVQGERPV